MKTFRIRAMAVAMCLAFSAGAAAQAMSKAEYDAARKKLAAEHKAERAELDARYSPGKPVPAAKKERVGEYVDDSVITAKVKAAVFEDPSLKSMEINVETSKGVVQLSGFVRSRADINRAVAVARKVKGVTSVRNDMVVKGQQ